MMMSRFSPLVLRRGKTIAKKVTKKIMKKEEEETEEDIKHWKMSMLR
jgi:hypothetical protein